MLPLSRMSRSCCREYARNVAGRNHAEGHFRKHPDRQSQQQLNRSERSIPSSRAKRTGRVDRGRSPAGFVWHAVLAFGGFDQCTKELARTLIVIHGPFGVPLDGEDEMIRSSCVQGLNNSIIGAASRDAQSFADRLGGLMMGGIH